MSLRNRLVLFLVLSTIAVLAGCGSSNTPITPPPTGSYSNTDLNGTYVFSVTGSDGGNDFVAIAGTFTACGCSSGTISGGTVDINDSAFTTGGTTNAVSGGSYAITSDGRGRVSLSFTQGNPLGGSNLVIAIVLSTDAHGLVTEFDGNGSGCGTLDLQSTVAQSQLTGSSYSFGFTGTNGSNSYANVGAFTVNADTTISGVEDYTNDGAFNGVNPPTIGGFVDLSTVPGTAQISPSVGLTLSYDVYPVDATHLKFIEVDAGPWIAGDAFTATTTIPSASVFTFAGEDFSLGGPITAAGIIATDGGGTITASSTEDLNDVLNQVQVTSFGGSYTPVTNGRSVFTLNGFGNGGGTGNYVFAAYPSTGGMQLLEIDTVGVTAGVALAQTNTTFAATQGYGMNLTGVNPSSEEDDIVEFSNNGGTLKGKIDINDQGATNYNKTFAGAYTASGAPGRGQISFNNTYGLITYTADSSTSVFVEVDGNQVGLGTIDLQVPPAAKSNFAAMHLAAIHAKPGAKGALKRKQKK